jgi:protein KTI12
LNTSTVVIADFNNYIKSIRYELYCRAREAATTHAVLYCTADPEFCAAMNSKRPAEESYESGVLKDLIARMEEPNEQKKWDSPLFTVDEKADLPCKDIADALLRGKEHKPSEATLPQKMESSTYLFELDRISQAIVAEVIAAQASDIYSLGTDIPVSFTSAPVRLQQKVALPAFRRVTRAFVKLMTTKAALPPDKIADAFVAHINAVCNS